MKVGILAIVLGTLGIALYLLISALTVAVKFDENGWAYGAKDWTIALPFAIVGLVLITLGIFRLKWTKASKA